MKNRVLDARRSGVLRVRLALVLSALLAGAPIAWGQMLRVGVGAKEIVVPPGTRMDAFPIRGAGQMTPRTAEGTHDPVMVRSVVLEEKGTILALTSCDLVILVPEIRERAKALAAAAVPIPADNILIAATHTHHSPAQGDMFGIPPQTALRESVAQAIAETITEAYTRRVPGRIGAGCGFVDLSFNRRFINREGRAEPVRENPKHRYYGPVDREVGVVRIDDLEGSTRALLVNYAAHPMVMGWNNRQFTADFPGAVARYLTQKVGRAAQTLYFSGALGNLTPYDQISDDWDRMERMGVTIGAEALRVYQTIQTNPTPGLRIKHRDLSFVSRDRLVEETTRLNMIFFENTVIATQAGELFVELALDFKRRATYLNSMVFGLMDGFAGYIPHREAYRHGGYGVDMSAPIGGRRTIVPEGFGEQLLAAWLEMMYEEDGGPPAAP